MSHFLFDSILTCLIGVKVESITAKASIISPLSARLSSGVSVCGVGERTQRPLSGLPGRQQPDPNWTQDNRHGGDGGGVGLRRAMTESLVEE